MQRNGLGQESLDQLFASLWKDYTAYNPQAKRIYQMLLDEEKTRVPTTNQLVNDHVAFRTFKSPLVGVSAVSQIFKKYGYQERGEYQFADKKLYARHLQHEDPRFPKVFISELEVEKFSVAVQELAKKIETLFSAQDVTSDAFLWSGRTWPVSYKLYEQLLAESEYAAWLYVFGFRCNHFTISLGHLQSFKELSQLNDFIKKKGISLNAAGGEIKGSPAVYLEQSSTLAETVQVSFEEGNFKVPACYYEFARRYPQANGELYQGFVTTSADKIFESTNVNKN